MEWRYLISEDKESISLGRIGWWVTFILLIYFWFTTPDKVPSTLFETFGVMTAYNFGKKLITPFKDYLISKTV